MSNEDVLNRVMARVIDLRDGHKETSDYAIAYQTVIEIIREEIFNEALRKERNIA